MRILVVNPNRVEACTELIGAVAAGAAAPGTEVVATAPASGPVVLSGRPEVLRSAMGVLDRVEELGQDADAIVLAGFGEPGQEAAQELAGKPVLDITECGPALAQLLGRRYAVVTSTEEAVPVVEDRLHTLHLDGRCAGVLPTGLGVPELVGRREDALAVVTDVAKRADADVVVLGCGGMAGMAPAVRAAGGVPVVDPVAAAVRFAESVVALAE